MSAQLRSRHWIITDGNGKREEVRGDGVVGNQPVLRPGEKFEYTSGAVLQTPHGSMQGSYRMVTEDGRQFDAEIAAFALMQPGNLNDRAVGKSFPACERPLCSTRSPPGCRQRGGRMAFECGFDTVGNATVILHDREPLLATDPWISGPAYFGSWGLAHQIPAEQLEAVRRCKYLWVSHGHPDHLSGDSLAQLQDKTILVPNHRGSRVFNDLRAQGYNVRVLPDREWFELRPRVHVLSIPDYNQDAVLIVDVNGRLVLNFNDAGDRGWGGFVRNVARGYRRLPAQPWSADADMNYFSARTGGCCRCPRRRRWARPSGAARVLGRDHRDPFQRHAPVPADRQRLGEPTASKVEDIRKASRSACELLPRTCGTTA